MSFATSRYRIVSVVPTFTAGGVGTVCRYAAEGMAKLSDWNVALVSLHDPKGESVDASSGLHLISLGLNGSCSRQFLDWLSISPPDLMITSDVAFIESAFPFVSSGVKHIVQIHDSGRRYRDVAIRNQAWVDGVTCVGHHIEEPLRISLNKSGFHGLLRTVHNGAAFPPLKGRKHFDGPLRLLFVGRVDALKGVFDFVPIMRLLKSRGVPVELHIVGGENDTLRQQFIRADVDHMVLWHGLLPHERCYEKAAESDILMVPSRKESFGMVTVESMSMGCVPIAYDFPSGSVEIIEHGKNGLLIPLGDYQAWVATIEMLHRDRKVLTRLSLGAIKRARDCFSSDVMATNMMLFIQDVMCHSVAHPAQRKQGGAAEEGFFGGAPTKKIYQRLPEGVRIWIRNKVFSNPKVAHWLIDR